LDSEDYTAFTATLLHRLRDDFVIRLWSWK